MEGLTEQITGEELLQLSAVDSNFYGRYWFPKTCRQDSPAFHLEMDLLLDNPEARFVAFEIFRGGAKTTKLRLFLSKRVAFGISRTVVVVGKSQDHAVRTVEWLMKAVEYNRAWAQFFELRKGGKWTSSELEIIHAKLEIRIRVIALGITGSVRGVNVDDYRPDFILLDDPCDEENTATPDARKKIEDLVFGALAKSLAPRSEAPDAMMALAQTPLDEEDLIEQAMKDRQWHTARYGCFDDKGKSRWPARWTTQELLEDKQAHVDRNQLSLWLREMECILVNDQNAAFRESWLQYYDVLPDGGLTFLTVDPTPPPKEGNQLKIQKLDDAVIMVTKFINGKVFLVDYYLAKAPDPGVFIHKYFEMFLEHRPFLAGVETVLFQRVLKWAIEQEMQRRHLPHRIVPVEDKRKKETRILQAVGRYASNRNLVVKHSQVEFIQQYRTYRKNVTGQRDDMLDALSIAMDLMNPALEGLTIEGSYSVVDEDDIPALEFDMGAP